MNDIVYNFFSELINEANAPQLKKKKAKKDKNGNLFA